MPQPAAALGERRHRGSAYRLWRSYTSHLSLILMFLPGFVLFFVFEYFPLYGVLIAFKDYRLLEGVMGSPWAGLAHFERLFTGPGFKDALRNTVIIAALKLVIAFPAPIILALMLNEVRVLLFRKIIQTVSYLPHFFSWVILSGMMFAFLSLDGGFNQLLGLIGVEPVSWLLYPDYFYGILVASDIWQSIGWGSIIYFAALAAIDPTLYDAAIVDGAGRGQRAWHITLPSIMPTVIIVFLLGISGFLSVGFDQVYNLMTPATSQVAEILDTYVLRRLLALDYALGTAAGIFKAIVGLALVLIGNALVKLYDKEQGLW
ncbi:sugar ABC transporter permease [Paenibacillus sp. IB182496]|uniref:Sugar ABC transporter permease n=1 Tax=Paenibacillus sabuli TaxID=2772509 RepID=A0A927BNA0_9BACL|nr:ABC transporter permease subunit [Paenibacillus sabuli]MBD2843656.1 sugar ABC transporter permease [Paenibacillus sabuli]